MKSILVGDNTTSKVYFLNYFDPIHPLLGSLDAPGTGSKKAESLAYDEANDEIYIANESDQTVYVGRAFFN